MIVDETAIRRTLERYQEHITGDPDLAEAVRARVRSDRRKRIAVLGGVMSGALLVGVVWVLDMGTSPTVDVASDAGPPGQAVGERLGLEPVEIPAEGCQTFASYDASWGYCLDGVARSTTELVLLAHEINGFEMTKTRIDYLTAEVELENYIGPNPVPADARYDELTRISSSALSMLEPLYSSTDLADYDGLDGLALAQAADLVSTRGIDAVACQVEGHVAAVDLDFCLDGLAESTSDLGRWVALLAEHHSTIAVVPDVVGLSESDATRALEEAAVRIRPQYVHSQEPVGLVIKQEPLAGSRVQPLDFITVRVSRGPAEQ